jgi:DNA repair protein RecO (recombination protein O)
VSAYVDDEGIVLRRVDYAEADRVLTLLTREHGKVGVIAKGVRKPGSRLLPHTDLFTRSRVQLARGRGTLAVLTQAQRLDGAVTATDALRATCAALCAELADVVLEPDHPLEPAIYDLVAEALAACTDPARDPRAAVAWFARRMIDRLGYAPELNSCANCGTRLQQRPALFSAAGGGLLCPRCSTADPGGVECSVAVIKVLRVIAAGDQQLFVRLRLDDATVSVLEAVTERELAQHIGRRLRSLEVLRTLQAQRSGT